MGRVVAVAAAAALVLVAAACGERREPTGAQSELYPVTVPSASGGKPIVVHSPAKRIAVIAPSIQRILVDLGARGSIAGVPLQENGDVDTQKIRDLHPDLIVASSTTDDQTLAQAARAAKGTPVYQAPDDSIRGVEETITELGVITARQAEATQIVQEIEKKRAVVRKHLRKAQAVGAFLATGFFPNIAAFTTVSNQSLAGDLLREAHARNVVGDSAQAGQIDAHDLLQLAPEWVVATTTSKITLPELRRNKVTKRLEAVAKGRFATVDGDLLDPGPTIGQGLLELARNLHPDAFR
jgi:ABC-type Fe3+-hydroxamate transport system substrate-binding protein